MTKGGSFTANRLKNVRYNMPEKYLECARIVGTHGVHGAVRAESLCDSTEVLCSLPRMFRKTSIGYEEMKVANAFAHKTLGIVTFEKIDTLDKAIALRDVTLYADREDFDLDEGDFFISDLIGLDIKDEETDEKYGVLSEVISPAGRDIYAVKRDDGKVFYIPCVPEFIRRIAPDEKAIFVHLIEGMIE